MFCVKEIFDSIEKEFINQLNAKITWNRQEIMTAFLKAKIKTATKIFEKEGE
jgi:hypothetical protein